MKDIGEYINEGIFDISKNLEPVEIARSYVDFEYNKTDGSKDCLGNSLSKSDLIAVCDGNNIILGSYVSKKGAMVEFIAALDDPSDPKNYRRTLCSKIIKVSS